MSKEVIQIAQLKREIAKWKLQVQVLTAERDRQYDENVDLIAKMGTLQLQYEEFQKYVYLTGVIEKQNYDILSKIPDGYHWEVECNYENFYPYRVLITRSDQDLPVALVGRGKSLELAVENALFGIPKEI